MMQNIIIDTDIGDDIDDALALALSLNSNELNILGISTVFKNTPLRTKLLSNLLKVYKREDIPVVSGIGKPIVNNVNIDEIPCQCTDLICPSEGINTAVTDFYSEILSKNKAIILAIGPLTNIAKVIKEAPYTKKNIEKIVLMGGIYSRAYSEWNIKCDPEAAKIVFNSGIPIVMVGLDVTLKCKTSKEDLQKLYSTHNVRTDYLSKLLKMWLNSPGTNISAPILHDPLALGYIINPNFLKIRKTKIDIECTGDLTRGVTVDCADVFTGYTESLNCEVCTDVDVKAFHDFFMETVLK
jgi:purine nucleosidase/pyrimidine-specific ribonucleoside hydrolase